MGPAVWLPTIQVTTLCYVCCWTTSKDLSDGKFVFRSQVKCTKLAIRTNYPFIYDLSKEDEQSLRCNNFEVWASVFKSHFLVYPSLKVRKYFMDKIKLATILKTLFMREHVQSVLCLLTLYDALQLGVPHQWARAEQNRSQDCSLRPRKSWQDTQSWCTLKAAMLAPAPLERGTFATWKQKTLAGKWL